MNQLILVGANRYGVGLPGATLQGCINDLRTVYGWVRGHLYSASKPINVTTLDDERDTSDAVRNALNKAVADAGASDWIWVHDSSHGTTIPINGKNHGALCCHNSNWNDRTSFIIDDDFRILEKAKAAKKIVTIDACEWGDALRMVLGFNSLQRQVVARYINPPLAMQFEIDENDTETRAIVPQAKTSITSIGFCKRGPGFTCSDVRDGSGAYGAGTHYFTPNILQGKPLSRTVGLEAQTLTMNHFEQQPVMAGPDVILWE